MKIFNFATKKEVTNNNSNMPSGELVDPLVEAFPVSLFDGNCVVATHSVDTTEELASFALGYAISAAKIPPKVKERVSLSDDAFREFLTGFYVGTVENVN